jgi:PKD repeat protein/endonuclease I
MLGHLTDATRPGGTELASPPATCPTTAPTAAVLFRSGILAMRSLRLSSPAAGWSLLPVRLPLGPQVGLPLLLAALAAAPAAAQPAGYYASVDPSSAASLRETLHAVIDDHTKLAYTSSTSADVWDCINAAEENPANSGQILDIYKNAAYTKISGGTGVYNREHSWPKSYGFPNDGANNYPYTDCHHLFASDTTYNADRGNLPFGDCGAGCTERATLANDGRGGGSGVFPGNSNWFSGSGYTGVWQTWSGRKGDLARAILYMDLRYEGGTHGSTGVFEPDLRLTNDPNQIEAYATGNNENVAYMGLLDTLLAWHAADPVDARERRRNDVVQGFQGNRNPFVDHPEWVGCLWQGQCAIGGTNVAPVANFTFTTSGLTATFTDTSTDSDGTVTAWAWNFGDGATASTRNPVRTYAAAGSYSVALAVIDDDSATHSRTQTVAVTTGTPALANGVPVNNLSGATGSQQFFTLSVPAGATSLQFSTSGGSGDADLYVRFGSAPTTSTYSCRSWASGNGETCSISPIQAGTYHVLVHGYAAYSGLALTGSYATATNTAPVANFTFTTAGLTATFTDTSTDSGGSVVGWAWNFGDGGTSTSRNPTRTYATAGTRTVSLTVTDNGGLTGATSRSVTVASSCTAVTDTEPNNSTSAAQSISGACNQVSGTFTHETTTNDYFRLSLPAGKTVTARLEGLSQDYDLYLYRAGTSSAVAQSTNGGTTADQASWTNSGSASVTVYVRVYRYASTKATYQLRVSY